MPDELAYTVEWKRTSTTNGTRGFMSPTAFLRSSIAALECVDFLPQGDIRDRLLLLGVAPLQGDIWGLRGFVARALLTQFPIARLFLHCRSSFLGLRWGESHSKHFA